MCFSFKKKKKKEAIEASGNQESSAFVHPNRLWIGECDAIAGGKDCTHPGCVALGLSSNMSHRYGDVSAKPQNRLTAPMQNGACTHVPVTYRGSPALACLRAGLPYGCWSGTAAFMALYCRRFLCQWKELWKNCPIRG